MSDTDAAPFGPGGVSLGLYTDPAPAAIMLDRLFEQAAAARQAGLRGVSISEHHGGFPGYVPNPIQVSGWILDRVRDVWAGPCPVLLPLRPPVLVAEELCWLAALHPGRVGAGFAPGYLRADFDVFGASLDDRATLFQERLTVATATISGRDPGSLRNDPAISSTRQTPVPFVTAAGSTRAARRAARAGGGMLADSLAAAARIRRLFDDYEEAGGRGPWVLNRRIWMGRLPVELAREQLAQFSGATNRPPGAERLTNPLIHGSPPRVAEELIAAVGSTGATHLGLKFHLAGITQDEALDQIDALRHVLPAVKAALARNSA